jgi:hypothetical protein
MRRCARGQVVAVVQIDRKDLFVIDDIGAVRIVEGVKDCFFPGFFSKETALPSISSYAPG